MESVKGVGDLGRTVPGGRITRRSMVLNNERDVHLTQTSTKGFHIKRRILHTTQSAGLLPLTDLY